MAASNHFVAYHNCDELGPYYGTSARQTAKRGETQSFFTAKNFRSETLEAQYLWAFDGSGRPKHYRLVSHGVITGTARRERPKKFRRADHQYGTMVYFRLDQDYKAKDVTDLPWFRKLLRQQGSFRNGFNPVKDRSIILALEKLVSTSKSKPEYELVTKISKELSSTTRKALLDARIGQGQFRESLLDEWSGCAVMGCKIQGLLRASHIKPWSKCNNRERLDQNNGLLLIANLEAAFENGLITFSDSGRMIVSSRLSPRDQLALAITKSSFLRIRPSRERQNYLRWHRENRFQA